MRISDWSSDVCSSDLHDAAGDKGTRLIKVSQMPILAGLAGTDIEQVGAGAHRSQQWWIVVEIVASHRRTPPTAFAIGRLLWSAWLLRGAGTEIGRRSGGERGV